MTDYTELKRLAEAAKLELADIANVVIEDGDLSHHELFQSLASPDVVLGLIKSLEHAQMAAEAEAKEVDKRNAVIDRLRLHIKHIGNDALRTQNQALVEALKDARTIMVLHRDLLDLKSSATWQLAIDPIDKLLTQAEGGV